MLYRIKTTFFVSFICMMLGLYNYNALPSPGQLLPELKTDPIQHATYKQPFNTTVNNITYHIKPLYSYELYGLVVSKHEAHSWLDSFHKEIGDHINTTDLCVIWGDNAFSGIYEHLSFTSGSWTCYVKGAEEAWKSFSNEHLSNNHLLVDKRAIAKMLNQTRIGDQIHFKGYLAEYSHGVYQRGSSTVRYDTGNGACETVYLESFSILKHAPNFWRIFYWTAVLIWFASIYAWFVSPEHLHVEK